MEVAEQRSLVRARSIAPTIVSTDCATSVGNCRSARTVASSTRATVVANNAVQEAYTRGFEEGRRVRTHGAQDSR